MVQQRCQWLWGWFDCGGFEVGPADGLGNCSADGLRNCSSDVDGFEDCSSDRFEDGPADGFEDQQVDAYGFEDGTANADGFEGGSEGWQKMLVKAGYNKQQQQWRWKSRRNHKTTLTKHNREPKTTTNLTAMVATYLVLQDSRWMRRRTLQIHHRHEVADVVENG